MKKLYRCLQCGKVTIAKYKESPNLGSYYVVKCKCGNKGSSGDNWEYKIKGFIKEKPEN